LPLAQSIDADSLARIELLPDQGLLTIGLAATLRRRAHACGRVLLVPVSEVAQSDAPSGDALVPVPSLPRSDFRRLLTLALQG
ncbi:hypothetical protein, partial [Acinetobacter nosocomialis]|uniref:hypothetical protein n=1 Tax=Acinetobacter nosocomialis TaxID=106654 RepID=UPI0013D8432D